MRPSPAFHPSRGALACAVGMLLAIGTLSASAAQDGDDASAATRQALAHYVIPDADQATREPAARQRLTPFRDARYGMFIHWGLYSVAGGEWDGKTSYGEWMMRSAKIPLATYRGALAPRFHAEKFDAAQWVRLAKQAGMKYIVISAKHHDGFAMFHTAVNDYNIVDATPFGRDAVRELAEEAHRQGLRFGVYYSHILDWSSPDATPRSFNNTWDFKLDQSRFRQYWQHTVIPHVTELMSNYGQIDEVWFDIGKETPDWGVVQLMRLVRRLQPHAVVNNRIQSFSAQPYGDFVSMGDNEIPQAGFDRDFESAMTLNDHWGYNKADHHWKSPDAVIQRLVDVASKGGNLLLNVGPTGDGVIPEASQDILRTAGQWLARNGQAIYGTRPLRTPYEFDWGGMTSRPGKIYLNVINWSPQLVINGLDAQVVRAYALSAPDTAVQVQQARVGNGVPQLRLSLPDKAPDAPVSVIVLETKGAPARMDPRLIQQGSGVVSLDQAAATLTPDTGTPANNAATWEFDVFQPGTFQVQLTSLHYPGKPLAYRSRVRVEVAGQRLQVQPTIATLPGHQSRNTQHPYSEAVSILGKVHLDTPGHYTLVLHSDLAIADSTARRIPWQNDATKLRTVSLVPTQAP